MKQSRFQDPSCCGRRMHARESFDTGRGIFLIKWECRCGASMRETRNLNKKTTKFTDVRSATPVK